MGHVEDKTSPTPLLPPDAQWEGPCMNSYIPEGKAAKVQNIEACRKPNGHEGPCGPADDARIAGDEVVVGDVVIGKKG